MRICLIAPPWLTVPPQAYGGTERIIDLLARGLAEEGHDVLLHTTGDSTCPVTRSWCLERAPGTRLLDLGVERQHVIDGHARARAWGVDLVHDHTSVGPSVAYDLGHGPPVVWTNHGPFTGPALDAARRNEGQISVLAISQHQASTAPHGAIRQVIHHGLAWGEVPTGDGRGGYAVFLGRMCPEKGPHRAVQAARRAGVPLLLAAKMHQASERQYFERRIRPWLGAGIRYVGEVAGAEKVALLGSASCLVNPITWPEPFGLVMIEALGCGTPAVAYPGGAAPEIIDHGRTGYLVHDAAALVDALLAAPSLDRRTCREAAEHRFSADRMVADHIATYESILAGDRRPEPHETDESIGLAG